MKLNDLIPRLPGYYVAKNGFGGPLCLYLKSPPGRGKTTTVAAAPKVIGEKLQKNLGLVIINGPLLTPQDAIGYLIPKHTEDGRAESLYTDPFWFKTLDGKPLGHFDGGIVFVDEADKMDTDVKKVIGECALSGRLGPHRLNGGWSIWMAGNRSADRSGSTKELDHLINRRMEIDITDDLQSWLSWSAQNGVSPVAQAFANEHSNIVFPTEPAKEQGPFCTPRSLVGADEYMQTIMKLQGDKDLPDDPLIQEEVTGMVGSAAAAQYFAFVKLDREMPKYEAIVKDPKGVKVPSKPDAQMLTCFKLAHNVVVPDISAVITYMERLPKEFAATFAHIACKRDLKLVATPAMQKWAMGNASLMAAISK